MSFRPLDGFIDFPENAQPEDPYMELTFDYEFAGKKNGRSGFPLNPQLDH